VAEPAGPFQPASPLGPPVAELSRMEGGFQRATSAGVSVKARAVIVAAGGGAFGPNRPPLPGIEAFEGKSVFYLVKRREDFRGKRVGIAGGGGSAGGWARSPPAGARAGLGVGSRAPVPRPPPW